MSDINSDTITALKEKIRVQEETIADQADTIAEQGLEINNLPSFAESQRALRLLVSALRSEIADLLVQNADLNEKILVQNADLNKQNSDLLVQISDLYNQREQTEKLTILRNCTMDKLSSVCIKSEEAKNAYLKKQIAVLKKQNADQAATITAMMANL